MGVSASYISKKLPHIDNCLPGDILIKNNQLTVVISNDKRKRDFQFFFMNSKSCSYMPIAILPSGSRNYLRCLCPGVVNQGNNSVHPPIYKSIKILKKHPEVTIEASGKNLEGKLKLTTKYELKPGERYLRISTRVTNVSDKELSFEIGDILKTTPDMYGFSQFTGPVRGFMVNLSPGSEQWFATCTRQKTFPSTSYIEFFPSGITTSIIDIWGAEVFARLNLKLSPKESYTYRRFLVAAPTLDIRYLRELIGREILDEEIPLGEVRGRVIDVYGRKVLSMNLIVKRGEEILHKTSFRHIKFRLKSPMAHRSGVFRLFLPPSNYTIIVEHQNAAIIKTLKVSARRTVRVTFDQRALAGCITGKVIDEKGAPIASRIDLIRDNHFLSSAFSESNGTYVAKAPPGGYKILISRGFEYSYVASEIEVKTGEKIEFNAKIRRITDYRKFGWFAGDQHLHSTYMDGLNKPEEMVTAAESSGLSWIFITDYPSAALSLTSKESSGVLALPAQEFSNKWGHFNALGITKRIRNNLSLDTFLSKVHEEGGIAIINHPYHMGYFQRLDNLGDSLKDFDGVEVWNGNRDPLPDEKAMRRWYDYLNQGKKMVAVASSDAHNVYEIGYPRTYVKVTGKLSLNKIIEAERNLRAFCTNGPLIRFSVEGKEPGEVLTQAGDKAQVKIAVDSLFPVSGVRLIKNGEKILDVKLKDEYKCEMLLDLKIENSCWLLAQVYGVKPMRNSRLANIPPFAFTNPVFIHTT